LITPYRNNATLTAPSTRSSTCSGRLRRSSACGVWHPVKGFEVPYPAHSGRPPNGQPTRPRALPRRSYGPTPELRKRAHSALAGLPVEAGLSTDRAV